jgi:hypothetical protein
LLLLAKRRYGWTRLTEFDGETLTSFASGFMSCALVV